MKIWDFIWKWSLDSKSKVQRISGQFLQGFTVANVKNYQTVSPSGKGLPTDRNRVQKVRGRRGKTDL